MARRDSRHVHRQMDVADTATAVFCHWCHIWKTGYRLVVVDLNTPFVATGTVQVPLCHDCDPYYKPMDDEQALSNSNDEED